MNILVLIFFNNFTKISAKINIIINKKNIKQSDL